MTDGLKIEIVSPERLVLSEMARLVTVPGTEGYFTIMAGHTPFMTTLRSGFVTVNREGQDEIFFIKGGFADVADGGVTILAEEALPFAEFDQDSLQAQIKTAEAELAAAKTPEEQTYAQAMVSALLNLALEASQLNGVHIH